MTRRFRILGDLNPTTTAATVTATGPPQGNDNNDNVDSDFVVILAALLCALICVLGLFAITRCSWIRRFSAGTITGFTDHSPPGAANKGLKKKVMKTLPRLPYTAELSEKLTECAICLTEFDVGEEIRVLPNCGHGFHVKCIDTWLGSHSSCPSCRQILVAASRCKKCGELPAAGVTGAHTTTTMTTTAGAGTTSVTHNRFLP